MFNFETEANRNDVDKLFEKFEEHGRPVDNITYLAFIFGTRSKARRTLS